MSAQAGQCDIGGVGQRVKVRVGVHPQRAGAQLFIQLAVAFLTEAVQPPRAAGLQRHLAVGKAGLLGLAGALGIPGALQLEGVLLALHRRIVSF